EWIQRDLAKVGIRVKLETFDWITYLSKMFQGLRPGHGAYQLSWGMTTNFWIDIVARSTRQPDKGVNVGWYANPRVDALLDTARSELDESRRVVITNPDKVFFPQAGYTKLDLAKYYVAVAEGALRGIAGRPIVLKRYVDGAEGEPFFQKRAPEQHPEWVETVELRFPSGRTARE